MSKKILSAYDFAIEGFEDNDGEDFIFEKGKKDSYEPRRDNRKKIYSIV